jgi:hypothetical protein
MIFDSISDRSLRSLCLMTKHTLVSLRRSATIHSSAFTLCLITSTSVIISLAQAPTHAQLRVVCDGRQGYQRLTNWSSGPTGFGGYYETEICGRLLSQARGQSEFVVEVNGKEGSGSGIFSMNCSNKPKGYWKSNPDFGGLYGAERQKRLSAALLKASKIYC